MWENVLILMIFLIALGYLVYNLSKEFTRKEGCSKSCGNCKVPEIEKILREKMP